VTSQPTRSGIHRPLLLGLWGLAALAAVGGLSGCYERVVRAKGLGADNYNVSEPYQESGKVDEWIFGSPGGSNKQRNNTKLPQ
jgi:hypothetical protein